MNCTILKHSFWTFGALLFMTCNKAAITGSDLTNSSAASATTTLRAAQPQENLLWIPVGANKTLQTAQDLLGNGSTFASASKNTRFTAPNTNSGKRTSLYRLNVNVNDIKPKGNAGNKSNFLAIRFMMKEGVGYTIFKSPFDNDNTGSKELSFAVVSEKVTATKLRKQLNPKQKQSGPTSMTSNAEYTLVLFNGSGNERATNLFKAGDRIVLLLVALDNKNYTSQVINLLVNFV